MSKYLVLFQHDARTSGMSVSELFAKAPPEQMKAGMALWQAWHQKCGPAILDNGSPLDNARLLTGTTVTDERSDVTGFSILEAASVENAVSLMNGHPHFHAPGASIQVLEFVSVPAP